MMMKNIRIVVAASVVCACLIAVAVAWAGETVSVHASFTPEKLGAPTNLSATATFGATTAGPLPPAVKGDDLWPRGYVGRYPGRPNVYRRRRRARGSGPPRVRRIPVSVSAAVRRSRNWAGRSSAGRSPRILSRSLRRGASSFPDLCE